jgi:hypothetical protein
LGLLPQKKRWAMSSTRHHTDAHGSSSGCALLL